jgi:hypothetical protein
VLERVAVAGAQFAAAALDVRKRSKSVVLHLEEPVRVVEGLRETEQGHRRNGWGDITFSVVARQYACQAQPFATQWGTPVAPLWPQEVGMAKRSTTKRERLDTPTGSHFAKRDEQGRFKEMDAVGRSLSADRRTKAKRAVKSGHGDQGDRKR